MAVLRSRGPGLGMEGAGGPGPGLGASGPGIVGAPQMRGANLRTPGPDWIALGTRTAVEGGALIARLADPSPIVIGGGGFESVARPLRRGIPQWRGFDTPTLPLSLIIGGYVPGPSVEGQCDTLRRLAGVVVSGDPEPPELLIRGHYVPSEAKGGKRWVISEAPAWDTSSEGVIRHPEKGYRQRQAVDLVLMLTGDDDELERLPASKPPPRYRHVKARHGDTFEKIAQRELGSKRFAHKLAALNGRSGGSVSVALHTGADVKVPTGDLLSEWRRDLGKKG